MASGGVITPRPGASRAGRILCQTAGGEGRCHVTGRLHDGWCRHMAEANFDIAGPMGRITRAEQIGENLAGNIAKWRDSANLRPVASIDESRRLFEVRLGVDAPPPHDTWAYMFGEGVHQLRAALDNAIVQAAMAAGAPKDSVKRLQFPITDTEKSWNDLRSQRSAVHDVLVHRLRAVQPWVRAQAGASTDHDLLRLLRDLDNLDKHWVHAQATVVPLESQIQSSAQFESAAAAAAEAPPQTEVFTPELADGALLLRWRTKSPIVKVTGEQRVMMQVRVRGPGDADLPICGILAALALNTRIVLEWLATGEQPTVVTWPAGANRA